MRIAVLLVIVAALPAPALAGAACGLIRDADKRRACFAEAERRPGECNLIRNNDDRRMCRLRAERR